MLFRQGKCIGQLFANLVQRSDNRYSTGNSLDPVEDLFSDHTTGNYTNDIKRNTDQQYRQPRNGKTDELIDPADDTFINSNIK